MKNTKRQRYLRAGMDSDLMELRQMGAKIDIISSKTCYIKLEVSGHKLSYIYNANKHDRFFLSRIMPYAMDIAEFETERDLIELIKIDIEQFQNAINSHNIDEFISINRTMAQNVKMLEDLFLYYNVEKSELDQLQVLANDFKKIIIDASRHDKRVYDKKEPNNL